MSDVETSNQRRYTDPDEVLPTRDGSMTVRDLAARCKLAEPGIVYIRHPPYATAATFTVLVETAQDLAIPFARFAIVNDLSETKHRPSGEYLDAILRSANSIAVHWANVWPANAFVRTVARFVSARLLRPGRNAGITFSFHETYDEALDGARAALRKAGGP